MRVPRWIAALALAAVVGGALGGPAPALAAPGDLDPTFGAGGLFVSEQGSTEAADLALQPDGKIVVVGTMSNQFVVYRLTASGSLDASFGGDGIVDVTGFLGSADEVGGGQALALQPDGKIVVAGGVAASAVVGDMAVARLNADGSLDAAFGGDGRVVVDFGAFSDWAYAVAVQSDNKIVVAGWMTQSRDDRFALARLGPDGVLDPSFDGDGRAVVDITSGAAQTDTDGVRDMVLLPDGKIVVAGIAGERSGSSVQDMDFCVARFNTNGSLDTTFGGGDGHTEVDFLGFRDIGQAVARQADGKIVIGGWVSTSTGEDDFGLTRLTGDGDLDTTLGGDGRATVDFPDPAPGHIHDGLSDLALDADGRIVAVGSASSTFETVIDGNIGLARLQPDGSPDAAFGANGLITTDVFGFYDAARAVVLQADGKIVVAGVARRSADHSGPADNLAVARYDMAAGRPSAVYLPLIVRQPQPVFPLANGDFEAGHSGWQEYSKQGYILIVDNYYPLNVQHHGGGWGAWLGGAYNEVSFIEQTVTVPADRPVLTYWHYIHSEDACGNDFGGVVINGSAIDRYDLCAATGTGGWRLHQVDLGGYAGQTVRLQLRAETDAAANSNLMIDDVEFVARTE